MRGTVQHRLSFGLAHSVDTTCPLAPGWKAAKRTVTALRSFLTALDAFAERCRTSSSVGGVLAWLVEHIDYAKHIQVPASHSGTL